MSTTATTKVCTKCGTEQPIENYRVHKSGFVLNQCKHCEREASKARAAKAKNAKATTFQLEKSGKSYTASLAPMAGARKVTSPNTTKVMYVNADRDTARNLFANWAGVPYTGISATLVTE